MFRCNGCWNELSSDGPSVVTTCQHLYCLGCAQQLIEGDDPSCPICSAIITTKNVKPVHVLSSASTFKATLAGQTPEVAMSSAMAAIQFYNQQQELNSQLVQQQMQGRIDQTRQQCLDKLVPLKQHFESAKRKFQQVSQQKKALEQANQELTDKYNQKAIQDKKLKDAFAVLQQENDSLRRQNEHLLRAVNGGGTGGGGAGGVGLQRTMTTTFNGGAGMAAGRTSRMGLDGGGQRRLGMEGQGRLGLDGGRPGTVLARHQQHMPDPSPLQSPNFQQGAFGFDTPDNQPQSIRRLHTAGGGGSGAYGGGTGSGGSGGFSNGSGGNGGFMAQLGGGGGGGGHKLMGLPGMGGGRQDQRRTSGQFQVPSNLGSL